MCNPLKARQCFNLPQSAIRLAENAKSLRALEPGTARAQERLKIGPEASEGCILRHPPCRSPICRRKR
eukprot:15448716-Alexandrium_andersonii.AAC.1